MLFIKSLSVKIIKKSPLYRPVHKYTILNKKNFPNSRPSHHSELALLVFQTGKVEINDMYTHSQQVKTEQEDKPELRP